TRGAAVSPHRSSDNCSHNERLRKGLTDRSAAVLLPLLAQSPCELGSSSVDPNWRDDCFAQDLGADCGNVPVACMPWCLLPVADDVAQPGGATWLTTRPYIRWVTRWRIICSIRPPAGMSVSSGGSRR